MNTDGQTLNGLIEGLQDAEISTEEKVTMFIALCDVESLAKELQKQAMMQKVGIVGDSPALFFESASNGVMKNVFAWHWCLGLGFRLPLSDDAVPA